MGILSNVWVNGWLATKHQLVGLMELQRLVFKHHHTDTGNDPLWTYWLFLAYEPEVLAAIDEARIAAYDLAFPDVRLAAVTKRERVSTTSTTPDSQDGSQEGGSEKNRAEEKKAMDDKQIGDEAIRQAIAENPERVADAEAEAYRAISAALRKRTNEANHNVEWKVFLHLGALTVMYFIVLGLAASNTLSLMGFLETKEVSLGAYTYLTMAISFSCAIWAQLMIFRKVWPKGVKGMLSWSNGGLDYFDTRALKIKKNDEQNYELSREAMSAEESHASHTRTVKKYTLSAFTALTAMAWGILVFTRMSKGLTNEDGLFDMDDDGAHCLAMALGIGAGLLSYCAWMTSLRASIKEEEKSPEKSFSEWVNAEFFRQSKTVKVMMLLAMYALFGSMLGQTKMVFNLFGIDEDQNSAGYLFFVAALCLGRLSYSIDGIRNQVGLLSIAAREGVSERVENEWSHYKPNYAVGMTLIAALAGVFFATYYMDEKRGLQDTLVKGPNGEGMITPMGVAVLGAVAVWSLFKVGQRLSYRDADAADKDEVIKSAATSWFPSASLRPGVKANTGNELCAIVGNAVSVGAVGGTGMHDATETWGAPSQVVNVMDYAAQGALASQSGSAATYSTKVASKGLSRH